MTASELTKIEKRILLRAPRERVWRAITSIEEFSKWFGVKTSGVFEPGKRLELTSTAADCKGMDFYMVVEKMDPGRLFSWRWHPGMPDPAVDYSKESTTLVEFHLEDADQGTMVTVIESGFDQLSLARRAGVFSQNEKGWEAQMHNLERYVGQSA